MKAHQEAPFQTQFPNWRFHWSPAQKYTILYNFINCNIVDKTVKKHLVNLQIQPLQW